MVWHGVVWYGVVWYGVVWCGGLLQYLEVWYGVVLLIFEHFSPQTSKVVVKQSESLTVHTNFSRRFSLASSGHILFC